MLFTLPREDGYEVRAEVHAIHSFRLVRHNVIYEVTSSMPGIMRPKSSQAFALCSGVEGQIK